jgi:hypothetical protein
MADEAARPRLDFSATDGADLVERLEEASCGPRVKALMVDAVHARDRGIGPAQWHVEILARYGAGVATLLDEAEECMQSSGLWPWQRPS